MTNPEAGRLDEDRRSFSSRTPLNENPDRVVYRRGFVTRHQVSGWRFVMRRIAAGVTLHDTRMLVDPLRTQSRAVLMGLLVLATIASGCFAFTLIWPNHAASNEQVLADRSTSALYVRVGDQLHPVLNLTSARLIVGRPDNPTAVRSSALDSIPRGNLVGIPGAPERMVQSTARNADWVVCDAATGPVTGVTVIAGAPAAGGSRAGGLDPRRAVLGENGGATWLLWGGKRSRVDLTDRAVTGALGLGAGAPAPRAIATGLLNAVPEAPALTAPMIPGAGDKPQFDLPLPVGAVVEAHTLTGDPGSGTAYYAVLPDGLAPISGVVATMLRNTDSYGLNQPPRLDADAITRLPVSRALDTSRYPEQPVNVTDPVREPVTCAHWSQSAGAATSSLTLLAGSALPLPEDLATLELVGADTDGTAQRVALPPGVGYFTQTAGGLFWISDTGVRYGVDTESGISDGAGAAKTVSALGLIGPALPIPSSVLSLFAAGPTLSRSDALLAHDGLPPDKRPGRRLATQSAMAFTRGGETR